jgi:hypothetical protein
MNEDSKAGKLEDGEKRSSRQARAGPASVRSFHSPMIPALVTGRSA